MRRDEDVISMAKKLVLTNDSFPRTFAPHLSVSTTKDTRDSTAARHPQGRAAIHRALAPEPPKQEHSRRLKPPSSCSRAVESGGGGGHFAAEEVGCGPGYGGGEEAGGEHGDA